MARTPERAPAGERRSRLLILITLLIIFAGGFFLGWRAVHPLEAPLPLSTLTALQRIATLHRLENASTLPDFMCTSTLDVSIVTFLVSAGQASQPSARIETELYISPTIAEKIIAAIVNLASPGLSSLSHLQAQDTVVYLSKDSIPFLQNNEEKTQEREGIMTKTTTLDPRQAASLGWHLYSQLPPPSSAPGKVRVLVLVTPADIPPLVIETTSSRYSKLSYRVAENLLLVLVPAAGEAEVAEEKGHTYSELAAKEIINWFYTYTTDTVADNSSNLRSSTAQQCMHKAAAEVSNFLKILNLAPQIGIKITADVAHAADASITEYFLAEKALVNTRECLKQSRIAWKVAHALSTNLDLGARPQLPSEHVLALLLPIGLPIFLAIVQAVGREVKDAKKSLRKEDLAEEKKKNS